MRTPLVIAILASPIAHADTNVRASIQPTFATISRTTTYQGFSPATSAPVSDERGMTGSGFGARLEAGAGWNLRPSVELGGVLRLGYHPFARWTASSRDATTSRCGPCRSVHRSHSGTSASSFAVT